MGSPEIYIFLVFLAFFFVFFGFFFFFVFFGFVFFFFCVFFGFDFFGFFFRISSFIIGLALLVHVVQKELVDDRTWQKSVKTLRS